MDLIVSVVTFIGVFKYIEFGGPYMHLGVQQLHILAILGFVSGLFQPMIFLCAWFFVLLRYVSLVFELVAFWISPWTWVCCVLSRCGVLFPTAFVHGV